LRYLPLCPSHIPCPYFYHVLIEFTKNCNWARSEWRGIVYTVSNKRCRRIPPMSFHTWLWIFQQKYTIQAWKCLKQNGLYFMKQYAHDNLKTFQSSQLQNMSHKRYFLINCLVSSQNPLYFKLESDKQHDCDNLDDNLIKISISNLNLQNKLYLKVVSIVIQIHSRNHIS
jgi:hypothetical protein